MPRKRREVIRHLDGDWSNNALENLRVESAALGEWREGLIARPSRKRAAAVTRGHVRCLFGGVDYDGTPGGDMRITIRARFDVGRQILQSAIRRMDKGNAP
jgi:hypothetical protein